MNALLLDLGNTRVKWALHVASRGVVCERARPIASSAAALLDDWRAEALPAAPARALGIEVAGLAARRRIEKAVRAAFGLPVSWVRPQARCGRLEVAYAEPERLGADRFVAMLEAVREPQPTLIFGVGSALTADHVDSAGRHHGGLIIAGRQLQLSAITRRLRRVRVDDEIEPGLELGIDTSSAVANGLAYALAGAVLAVRSKLASPGLRCWLHGGDAPWLAAMLGDGFEWRPQLLWQGLLAWAQTPAAAGSARQPVA